MAAAAYRDWPLLPDDITRDIFARIQPDDPSYFFRVSHLCKGWRRALSDPDFARRLHDRNAAPLLVGFLHDRDNDDERLPPFFRTAASPFSPKDAPDRRDWKVLDYRHGRALFISKRIGELGRKDLLIWDPVTGLQRSVPVAPQASRSSFPGAAVVCAAPDCSHRPGCNGAGDFQVALVFSDDDPQLAMDDGADEEEAPPQIKGFLYSSHSDTWTEVATLYGISQDFKDRPSVLAGESLYFLSYGLVILEFDMSANTLSEIALPDIEEFCDRDSSLILVHDENGGIGMAEATDGNISLWSRDGADVSWTLTRTFDRSDLHLRGPMRSNDQSLLGFVEGSSVIFVANSEATFTFDLTSGLAKIVVESKICSTLCYLLLTYVPHSMAGSNTFKLNNYMSSPSLLRRTNICFAAGILLHSVALIVLAVHPPDPLPRRPRHRRICFTADPPPTDLLHRRPRHRRICFTADLATDYLAAAAVSTSPNTLPANQICFTNARFY
ncbi:hypothetical protein QYE76_061173 [Lolium multiflorum]|uniref:F-box domain-containing protein n=1 Tax=Lolium multiflorum TaxID=4521 RepID=A0AAD8W4Z7_LOLMU|nr:hypothetical protein QYE76_061173 [Lolium multiflorum]